MSASRVTLEAHELMVRFGGSPGLDHITFTVRAGERLAIVGPSGVGKSSLLRAMAGLSPLHAGRVLVNGADVTLAPPERRNMVFLHQTPTLFPHLPVLENVSFPQRVRGASAADAAADARRLLVTLGLEGLERRRPEALSGGQRHRVALARALMARPAVLLLDEPLGALDPSLRTDVRAAIQLAQERMGGALVIVTHDLDEALLMGDEVAVLLDGGIVQRSSPRELCEAPASLRVARFLEMPNIIATTRLVDGQLSSVLGIVPTSSPLREPALVARADALRLAPVDSAPVHGVVVEVQHRAQRVTTSIDVQGVRCEAIGDDRAAEPGTTVGVLVDWSRIALVSTE